MDKAPAYGAGDSEFESRYGLFFFSFFGGAQCFFWPVAGGSIPPSKHDLVVKWLMKMLSFPGWRNWQRARLLTGRLRVRASLWEILFVLLGGRRGVYYKEKSLTTLFRAG